MGVLRGPPGIQHIENGENINTRGYRDECLLEENANTNTQGNFSSKSLYEHLVKEDSELVVIIFLL